MYDYVIRDKDYQLIICKNQQIHISNQSIQSFFNDQLKKPLTTLEARIKTTKKQFGFKAKVPIYVDEGCLWMCIRSYRHPHCIYINRYQIKSFHQLGESMVIEFLDQHMLKLKGYRAFLNQLEKCRLIEEWVK